MASHSANAVCMGGDWQLMCPLPTPPGTQVNVTSDKEEDQEIFGIVLLIIILSGPVFVILQLLCLPLCALRRSKQDKHEDTDEDTKDEDKEEEPSEEAPGESKGREDASTQTADLLVDGGPGATAGAPALDEAELAEKVAAAKAAKAERGARKAERKAERQEATQASNEKAKEAQIPEKKVAPPAAAKRSSRITSRGHLEATPQQSPSSLMPRQTQATLARKVSSRATSRRGNSVDKPWEKKIGVVDV